MTHNSHLIMLFIVPCAIFIHYLFCYCILTEISECVFNFAQVSWKREEKADNLNKLPSKKYLESRGVRWRSITGNWKIVTFSLHPGTQQQQRRNRSSAASAPQNFDDIYVLDNKITSSCRAKWNSQGQAHSRRAGSIILNQIINLLLNITLWNDTKTHFVFFKHQQRCMLTSPGLWTQYHLLWALPWIKIVWLRC